jgi:hypothetical protein
MRMTGWIQENRRAIVTAESRSALLTRLVVEVLALRELRPPHNPLAPGLKTDIPESAQPKLASLP